MRLIGLLCLLTLTVWGLVQGWSLSQAATPDQDQSYIKVEIKGQLKHGVLTLEGETTGTEISAGGVSWELDLSAEKSLLTRAEQLNGKSVLVAGDLQVRENTAEKKRWIVAVRSLQAGEKTP